MKTTSFYPGPSRVYSKVPKYFREGYKAGILSANHRSEEFMTLAKETKSLLGDKLNVPEGYQILFTSSATECWEIFGQSLADGTTQHFFNGAFGQKWATVNEKLVRKTKKSQFPFNAKLPTDKIDQNASWICLTHCETSNGTFISNSVIEEIFRTKSKDQLIAVDATSTMGGLQIDFGLADFWFASVQKCFGLPAGLGLLIVSEKAIAKAEEIGERNHYNSLLTILDNAVKHQTHFTPNVAAIYLLNRVLKDRENIAVTDQLVYSRFISWNKVPDEIDFLRWLVEDEALRSPTVLALECQRPDALKSLAEKSGFILGNGYGEWKESSVRIANYPAIKNKEVRKMMKFLLEYSSSLDAEV